MKKHFVGLLIFLFAFFFGLIASPIRFTHKVTGDGIHYFCMGFESMYFVRLELESEGFETNEEAREIFQQRLENPQDKEILEQTIIERNPTRAVLFIRKEKVPPFYCIVRVDKNVLYDICSSSLYHDYAFEAQNF